MSYYVKVVLLVRTERGLVYTQSGFPYAPWYYRINFTFFFVFRFHVTLIMCDAVNACTVYGPEEMHILVHVHYLLQFFLWHNAKEQKKKMYWDHGMNFWHFSTQECNLCFHIFASIFLLPSDTRACLWGSYECDIRSPIRYAPFLAHPPPCNHGTVESELACKEAEELLSHWHRPQNSEPPSLKV